MSTQTAKSVQAWVYFQRTVIAIMSISMPAAGWLFTQAFSTVGAMKAEIHDIQIKQAETAGNRFTSTDWTEAKTNLDRERSLLDSRTTRLEEALQNQKEQLIRIENKLDRIQEKNGPSVTTNM